MQEVIAGLRCFQLERLLTEAKAWTNLHAPFKITRHEIVHTGSFMYTFHLETSVAQDIHSDGFLRAIEILDGLCQTKLECSFSLIPQVDIKKDIRQHTIQIRTTKRLNIESFKPPPPDPINPAIEFKKDMFKRTLNVRS